MAVWLFVVGSALLTNFLAIPFRRAEMLTACQAPAKCAMGQLAASEHAALAAVGIRSSTYFWVLEAVVTLVVVFCTGAAVTLYWRRRESTIAFVVSLFLVLVATGNTINIPAMHAAHPEAWLWFAGLDAATASLIVVGSFLFPNGRFALPWSKTASVLWILFELLTLPMRRTVEGNRLMSLLLVLGLAAVVVAQVQRFRKVSTPIEQQQTKWLLLACALQAVSYVAAIVVTVAWLIHAPPGLDRVLVQTVLKLLIDGTMVLEVVALGFAIRRHRLWDIDVVINRSLVYGGVTVLLALLFGVSVFLLRALAVRVTADQQTPLVLAVSTMVVGALFAPTRRRLCLFVDRRFYGIHLDVDQAEQGERARRDAQVDDPPPTPLAGIPIRPIGHLRDLQHDRTLDGGLESDIADLVTLSGDGDPLPLETGAPPQNLPRFDKLEFIGRGGMSRVYRAEHPGLHRPVAIKMMLPQLVEQSPRSVIRFEREGQIMCTMEHDNIVRLFDRGKTDEGVRYQVLEYIGGPDLGSYLAERGRLELIEALPLLEEIASALDYIHSRNVVHRDIKPSNILLDPTEQPRGIVPYRAVLTDFGIARASAMDRLTATELIGTLVYIAPEQIQNAAQVDGRADVYSFGVLAYELLTGAPPFKGDHAMSLVMAHLKQPPADPRLAAPDLPDAAAQVLLTALAKKPEDRYATAGAAAAALKQSCTIRHFARQPSGQAWQELVAATSC